MDFEDNDLEENNMRIRASVDNGDAEIGKGGYATPTDIPVARDDNGILEPQVGMEFESEDAAKAFYLEYARRVGFSAKTCQTGHFRPHNPVTCRQFVCAKEVSKRNVSDTCEAMLKVELKGNKWTVTKFVKEHDHTLQKTNKLQNTQPRRQFGSEVKNVADSFKVPSGIMYLSVDRYHGSPKARSVSPVESNPLDKSTNCFNYYTVRPSIQRRTVDKDAQNMLEYFKKMQAENPGFFYAIQLDEDNRMANAFWADARSRTAYSHFGDVVALDTTYRVKQYKVPFAPFTGVNHHGQSILFGCALLQDDSEASYVWLFKTFLAAMSDCPPVSIVTDQDRAIQAGIRQVLPKTRHCISKWDVLREGQERLAHIYLAHPNFQVELYSCINLTETIEEFESFWASIIDKYDLRRDHWLQSLYNARRNWAPVYFRDSFFAALSPNQGFDYSFFDGYVNQQTTLPLFFRQYERAMEYWFEKEIEADFDTISNSPVLRTPSPMEKQAANLYTRKIFSKFQDELVETFVYTANKIHDDGATSTYRVVKFEDNHKAYTVSLNMSDMKASCSCRMFEYSGILCRHILTVFTVSNVLMLPSHYILRRWTRNAKSNFASDECIDDHAQESLVSRYNSLCREAIRYAEEGAIASETFIAAASTLREGVKKISLMKKNVVKITPQTSEETVSGYDDKKTSIGDTPLLWPRQDEIARCFNLNDSATVPKPIGDFNLLSMTPVSIQHDNGTPDNMVVLLCLKSMTWAMENRNSIPANRVAVITLKLQDNNNSSAVESEVKFRLSKATLEPMLRSMAHISEQLSKPANRVAIINLKLQDMEATAGESEVKFQVSRDTLGAMLRSMAYIRDQLSLMVDAQPEPPTKKQRY